MPSILNDWSDPLKGPNEKWKKLNQNQNFFRFSVFIALFKK